MRRASGRSASQSGRTLAMCCASRLFHRDAIAAAVRGATGGLCRIVKGRDELNSPGILWFLTGFATANHCHPVNENTHCSFTGASSREELMRLRHYPGLGLGLALAVAASAPFSARAEDPIRIGYPMPLSGPAAVYGVPVTK